MRLLYESLTREEMCRPSLSLNQKNTKLLINSKIYFIIFRNIFVMSEKRNPNKLDICTLLLYHLSPVRKVFSVGNQISFDQSKLFNV